MKSTTNWLPTVSVHHHRITSVLDIDHYFGGMVRLANNGLILGHKWLTEIAHAYDCPILVRIAMGKYNRDSLAGDICLLIR